MPGRSQGKGGPDVREVYTVKIRRNAETGVAVLESWELDGKKHRVDGPATISRDAQSGAVIEEAWIRNNQFHREDGPATLSRDPVSGKIKRSAWFLHGERVPTPRRPRPQVQRPPKPAAKHEVT